MSTDQDSSSRLLLAEELYDERRLRGRFLPSEQDLFGEPAWDMLLALYVCRLRNEAINITSACAAAHLPLSSGLRWIERLAQRDLVEIERDTFDRRQRFVSLAPAGEEMLTAYLDQALNRRARRATVPGGSAAAQDQGPRDEPLSRPRSPIF